MGIIAHVAPYLGSAGLQMQCLRTALARRFVLLGAGRFGTGDQFDHISKPLTINSGQTYNDMHGRSS
jgi:hypothetical protein